VVLQEFFLFFLVYHYCYGFGTFSQLYCTVDLVLLTRTFTSLGLNLIRHMFCMVI